MLEDTRLRLKVAVKGERPSDLLPRGPLAISEDTCMANESQTLALTNVGFAFDHPEAVAWGPDGRAYAGGEAGQLYRFGLDGK